jgi:hypothetical protein
MPETNQFDAPQDIIKHLIQSLIVYHVILRTRCTITAFVKYKNVKRAGHQQQTLKHVRDVKVQTCWHMKQKVAKSNPVPQGFNRMAPKINALLVIWIT